MLQMSEGIWPVTFMNYDLGYFDDETCRLCTGRQSVRAKSVTHVSRINRKSIRPEWTHAEVARSENFELAAQRAEIARLFAAICPSGTNWGTMSAQQSVSKHLKSNKPPIFCEPKRKGHSGSSFS